MVLGFECVRQILLWRNGVRKTMEVLSPEEETKLFEEGDTLLGKRDWVFDGMRLRAEAEKIYARKQEEKLQELERERAKNVPKGKSKQAPGLEKKSRPKRSNAAIKYTENDIY